MFGPFIKNVLKTSIYDSGRNVPQPLDGVATPFSKIQKRHGGPVFAQSRGSILIDHLVKWMESFITLNRYIMVIVNLLELSD